MPTFYEDIVVGSRTELGSWLFTADEIIRYAGQFDPQRFHLSEEEAAKTHFGRLCASGWHTVCVFMKLMVRERQELERVLRARGEPVARMGGSPGFKNLRWLKPVYVGDTIAYSSTITGKRVSASRPEWGIFSFANDGVNQHGEKVFAYEGSAFTERREKSI